MKLNKLVVSLFFLVWMALNLAIGLCLPFQRYAVVSIPYLLVAEVINIGLAYEVTLFLCSSFIRDENPPQLDHLVRHPRVALLYLSCNDAMPEALSRLNNQTYENQKIFVLDDSTDAAYKALVDSYDYAIVRRGHRRKAKAGNLNHWLSLYGDQFEYFVVLDNGGILEDEFIEDMLKYAEHPDNAQVAIFQSVTEAWNTNRPFSRLLDATSPLNAYLNLQVLNRSDSMLCWGHNILCRTTPIQKIGGFDEDSVTEDFATNLRLIECGYQSKAVNVYSYDATSETVQFHAVRMARWASGTLETAISKSWDVPLATKLRMFMGVYSYARWFFYTLGMLLVVWGYQVNWKQVKITLFFAVRWHLPHLALYPLAIILIYTLYDLVLRPLWVTHLTSVSWKEYWGHSLLYTSVCFYALSHLTISQVKSLLGKKAQFIIPEKRWFKSSLWDILRGMKWTVLLSLVVAAGLVSNPLARILHFIWYIPLFLSPVIIYWVQNAPAEDNTR
jgi:cellulose synthase/poly-beta-1,6-N-acetylglucosamine synthase-like glycosyltransferase